MRNKLYCAVISLILIFACAPAWADLVYTYTNSDGKGHVGSIIVTKSDDDDDFTFSISKEAVTDRTMRANIRASAYRRNNNNYVIITEPPANPNYGVNSHDVAFIYSYNNDDGWSLVDSFDMFGALNVREVAVSNNGNSLFAAAYGFEDDNLNNGIIEYSASNLKPTGNAYVFSKDIEGCIVHAESLIIDSNYIYSLFSVKSEDKWAESNLSVLDGQLLWKTRYTYYTLNPHTVDMALGRNNGIILAACMDEGGVSSEVSISNRNKDFETLVSVDNSGEPIGEVLSVGRDGGDGAYFIASRNNTETLYHCLDNDDGTLDNTKINVTPSSSAALALDSRKILWDNKNKLVFVLTGDKIIIIDDDDNVLKTFSTSNLGGYPTSISCVNTTSSKSKSNDSSGCDAVSLGLLALIIVPGVFKFKHE